MLVFVLAAPLVIAGRSLGVINAARIPVADLALAFIPMLAALVLEFRHNGWSAVTSFIKQALDLRVLRDPCGILITLGLSPLIYALTVVAVSIHGSSVPTFGNTSALHLLLMFLMFYALAVGEEVGWTGYATQPLQMRYGSLRAALILAAIWWLAHLPSMAAVGATTTDMAWWGLGAIGVRVLMIWLFDTTQQSVMAVILFHALLNTGRVAIFPAEGSRFIPEYQIGSYLIIGVIATIVVATPRLGSKE